MLRVVEERRGLFFGVDALAGSKDWLAPLRCCCSLNLVEGSGEGESVYVYLWSCGWKGGGGEETGFRAATVEAIVRLEMEGWGCGGECGNKVYN